ncbi:NAD(P)-binding protein [Xylaria palmicola]|nr:NAD(P)-binding protein [Xylaria palmicola]
MPSYLITGVSRGIGFELLCQVSQNPDNVVVGLVRDKAATEKKVLAELNRPNIHIVQADLTDYDSLKKSIDAVAPIVNGSLDCVIANAGYISKWSQYDPIGALGERDHKKLEDDMLECFRVNVIGNVHLFTICMPLILKGQMKKVVTISSGMGDTDLTREYKLVLSAPYSISKTAMNAAAAKFHAQYADQGVLFLNICPGTVDTGVYDDATEEQMRPVLTQVAAFKQYSPSFEGPETPAESVGKILL